MACLLVIAFAWISNGQTIKIVEKLPDGSFVVSIDNVEFRAISAGKAVELAKQKIDLTAAEKVNAELVGQVKEALLQRDLAEAQKALIQQKADSFDADFKRSQEDAKRNFSLFMTERDLRIEAQQFIPHGNVGGFGGKLLKFVDSPVFQAGVKIVIPIAQFGKTYFGRCQ